MKVIEAAIPPHSQPMIFQEDVEIRGNIGVGNHIEAKGNIVIIGDVEQSRIFSHEGNITVHGLVLGYQTSLVADGDIVAHTVRSATLRARRTITILYEAVEAHLVAKETILCKEGKGAIVGGSAEAGMEIETKFLGNEKGFYTTAKLTNFKQSDMFLRSQKLGEMEKKLASEKEKYEKTIQVIRILGEKVTQLPLAKKQELAQQVKRYQQICQQIAQIQQERRQLWELSQKQDELERTIIIHDTIYENVSLAIDNQKLEVNSRYHNVIVYKKGILILGDFDEYMKRKKYA
ncbi:MAG: FapA family protein [Brevinematales bacterium]|nr:FapA family protein [Brevinematales bacterium]